MVIDDQDNSSAAKNIAQGALRACCSQVSMPLSHRAETPWFIPGMLDMRLDARTAAMGAGAFDWPGQVPQTNLSGKRGWAREHLGASWRRSRLKGWRRPRTRKGSSKGPKGQSILCTPDWEAQPGTSPACDSILTN